MANEYTTYNPGINSFIPDIWEAALMYAQDQFVMPRIVSVFNSGGWNPRKFTEYIAGTIDSSVAETDDIARQPFNRQSLATLTPGEVGHRYDVTDRRMETDDVDNLLADIASDLGYGVFKKVESDLAGNMASFTGGTVGSGGGTLTWANIFDARAILAATAIPGPYICVLHEYQYRRLAQEANLAGISNAAPLMVRDDIQNNYYIGTFGGNIQMYVVGNAALSAGGTVYGGMFNRQAIAYDIRRGFRIETERDASLRATEIVASHGYAHGVVRATWGVTLVGDASAPS